MREFLSEVAFMLLRLGWLGLLIMGVLDSSFLFMPLGNDLLLVALTARNPERLPLYAPLAAIGSVIGCLIMDAISRKGGEAGLERNVPKKRLEYVKRKVKAHAGWALALGAIMPPPFPFTLFVIAAAALQYPRKRLLLIIGVARLARFSAFGLLAVFFGRRIIALSKTPEVQYSIIGLVVISIAGSALSIYRWVQRSRHARVPC